MTKYEVLKGFLPKEHLIKFLWEENKTYSEIGKDIGYDPHDISKLAKEYNILKNTKAISKSRNIHRLKKLEEEKIISAIDMYNNQFMSSREIGKIFKMSHSVILKALKDNGVEIREAHNPKNYKSRKVEFNEDHPLDSYGYKIITSNSEIKRAHRYYYEKYHNIKLTECDSIHHIDFNKTNNSKENLYKFKSNSDHCTYHRFIISHNYISPMIFESDILPKINKYRNYEFLYEEYIIKNKSVNQINKDIDNFLSRSTISNLLKEYDIFIENKKKHFCE